MGEKLMHLKGVVTVVSVMFAVFASDAFAGGSMPAATSSDYGLNNLTIKRGRIDIRPYKLGGGIGYYYGRRDAQGISAEVNVQTTFGFGAHDENHFFVGFLLKPGVEAHGLVDIKGAEKRLDNLSCLVSVLTPLGLRLWLGGKEPHTTIDASLLAMGFKYSSDADIEKEVFGFNIQVLRFAFHTAQIIGGKNLPVDLFADFAFGEGTIGQSKFLDKKTSSESAWFQAEFGLGVKAGKIGTFRLRGKFRVATDSYDYDEFGANGEGQDKGGSYTSDLEVSGYGGLHKLFGTPMGVQYSYVYEKDRRKDASDGILRNNSLSIQRHSISLIAAY